MDDFEELERMAVNAAVNESSSIGDGPSQDQISRWQQLFHYSYAEAVDRIQQHRQDLTRQRVSDEHWSLVQVEMEDEGFDRDAYDHRLQLRAAKPSQQSHGTGSHQGRSSLEEPATFIFKLDGPLSDPKMIQIAASLPTSPEIRGGVGREGEAKFCHVDSAAKSAIQDWLSRLQINYQPTFISVSQARKDLSSMSLHPTLGVDVTLPQYRPDQFDVGFLPTQCQYPVWYFFYGTLADSVMLSRLLSLSEDDPPELKPATISHGIIKIWGGKYKALVDGPSTACVSGWTYQVMSRDHEQALLLYETAKYEVVRCTITLCGGKKVKGCTFRFIDSSVLS